MIESLKYNLYENKHPIGVTKSVNWELPPPDYVYGLESKKDEYGAGDVTRSWQVHVPSKIPPPSTNFIKRNMTKVDGEGHKNQKEMPSSIKKKPFKFSPLPGADFVYGIKNRPSTPIKDVINNAYGNIEENEMKLKYDAFIKEKMKVKRLVVRHSPHYKQMLEQRKKANTLTDANEEKHLYKLKMFMEVGSKVAEGLKKFKTYKEPHHGNKQREIATQPKAPLN